MERHNARISELERRQARAADLLARLKDWSNWAAQRIREIGGGAPGGGGGSGPSFDDIADRLHATATVTTVVTKAASRTVAGVGAIQRFTSFDPGTQTLGDLTGVDEPAYSIDLDYKIKLDATVELIWKYKAWWVIAVDSCTDLDPT